MKDIVKFCGKTIEETEKSIDETQIKLKQNLEKDEYGAIQNTIQINEKATKKTLQQYKFKKYNYLKHNPKPAGKATDFQEDNENWVQSSYPQVIARAPLKRPSLTIRTQNPTIRTYMKNYDHQVHLIVSSNREFYLHKNHHKQMK